jgi:RimJ/RimL family protein N-acetyltransferase
MEGKKVKIRALEKKDLDEIMKWVNDYKVTRTLTSFLYPLSGEQEEKILEKLIEPNERNRTFAIETKKGEYLGNIGFHNIDWKNRNAEVGIVIGKKNYWNKGYGTDAMMTILDFAFNRMNLHKVYLGVFDFNQGGIKSYLKCGFKKEGHLRGMFYNEGKYHDMVMMGILKKEYKALAS